MNLYEAAAHRPGATTPSGKTPAEIAQCVQAAGTDIDKIQACAQ